MADVLVDNVDYGVNDENGVREETSKKSLWVKINDFRKESPYLFWGICLAVTVLLVAVIVAVIVIIKKRKSKSGSGESGVSGAGDGGQTESFKEPYMGTNTLNDEFDYLSSLLDSTLGDNTEFNKIVGAAKTL